MEYKCTNTKPYGMNSKVVARIRDTYTQRELNSENSLICEGMDTKTRIYTSTTKIDEVNIIADGSRA